MNYDNALKYIHSFGRISEDNSLNNMRTLLASLGSPEKGLKFVHIAGTNGKGSATVMLACVLKQAGYKVGANVSPFVLCFRERFMINGEMISEEELCKITQAVQAAVQNLTNIKFIEFEIVTAIALLYFAQNKCDIVCMEVGLGGRLDPSNVIQNTLVALIMRIGYDHTELLGDTLDKIAAEKCGILKNQCEVISYPFQPHEAEEIIALAAKTENCNLVVPQEEDIYFYQNAPFENRVNYGGYDLVVPFAGLHQAYNSSVVVEAALSLWRQGYNISDDNIIEGIKTAKFPARIEMLSYTPLVVLDGAHNEDGALALAAELLRSRAYNITFIIGVLKDKAVSKMLTALAPYAKKIITVTPNSPRAMSAEELASLAQPYYKEVICEGDVEQAIDKAFEDIAGGVCVCGSLYLAAQARNYLIKKL